MKAPNKIKREKSANFKCDYDFYTKTLNVFNVNCAMADGDWLFGKEF